MILYFSGSGNSKFVTNYIASKTFDEVISLNEVIKENKELIFESNKPFIIIAPIYAWRFPLIIEKILKDAKFIGSNELYFIGTMGLNSGNADKYLKKIILKKGLIYKGFCGIVMPSNYVNTDIMPNEEETLKCINDSIPNIKNITYKILRGESIKKIDITKNPALASGIVNYLFNKFMVSSKNFIVDNACTKCGLCVKKCPMNNIMMTTSGPTFANKCLNCYSCIHNCPKNSIKIKGQKINAGNYLCIEYEKWKQNR